MRAERTQRREQSARPCSNDCLWSILVLIGALATLAVGLGEATDADATAGWKRHHGPVPIELPRDHGSHPSVRTEWWYLTAITTDENGRQYGVQITFFRHGIDPSSRTAKDSPLRATDAIAAHMAIADIARGELRHAERLRRAAVGLAGASSNDLHVWIEDWELIRGEDDTLHASLADRATSTALQLTFEPQRQLVLHGRDGYSQKGPEGGNASMYLSWTRLAVSGELMLDGRTIHVNGDGWFDHEWGTSQLGDGVAGWDWFSLRLDDGRDLMVYRLRRTDGSADRHSSGTLVNGDGTTRSLSVDEVGLEVLDRWTSPSSGANYPSRWRLRVPSESLDLIVEPLLQAAELDTSRSTGTVYWEGPVTATGSTTGSGYVELTGYAGSMERVF